MRFRVALCAILSTFGVSSAGLAAAQPGEPAPPAAPAGNIPIAGRVVDGSTGRPIAGAELAIDGAPASAVTTADGRFDLGALAPGATVVVIANGYEAGLILVDAAWAGELVLMPVAATEIIEVRGEAPIAAPGATRIDRSEVSRIPGTGGDLVQTLSILPGVADTPGPVGWNGVIIRGSSPEDSKILIDGFEVPILYHTIAFRSILPAESIANLEYLPGGFDAAYGRASSGVVAVTTRGGGDDTGGVAEVSVIDGGVLAHTTAGKRTRVMVALRRSTIDLLLPSLIPEDADIQLTTMPVYYDGQARVDVDVSSRWKLAVSTLGADDRLEVFGDDEPDPDTRFYNRTRFLRLTADARYHHAAWTGNVAASGLIQKVDVELGRNLAFILGRTGATVRGEAARRADRALGLRDVVVRAGGEIDFMRHDLNLPMGVIEDEGEPEEGMGVGKPPHIDTTVDVVNPAAWAVAAANLDERVRLTAGLRVDRFGRSPGVSVQPRGELSVAVRKDITARLAAGAYRRPPDYLTELLDDGLAPERATQVVLGVEHTPIAGVRVQASTYYNDRTRMLTRAEDGGFANQGRGTTYGAELLVIARRDPWFGWLSYSLSRSTRVDRPGAGERLFDYDQPHDLTVALSWQRGRWQLGGRWSYRSGTPYTQVIGAVFESDNDRYLPVYGAVNGERVPAHHQLDLRVDHTWRLGSLALSAFLDVQNAYLNTPVVGYGYSYDYSERFAFEALPIIPSIGLRGEL